MKIEVEPMQQPVRKMVGRPLTISQRLVHLAGLAGFLKKHAPESLARTEVDYFPVRMIVGRPDRVLPMREKLLREKSRSDGWKLASYEVAGDE
jgi:hypothetical protein